MKKDVHIQNIKESSKEAFWLISETADNFKELKKQYPDIGGSSMYAEVYYGLCKAMGRMANIQSEACDLEDELPSDNQPVYRHV